MKKIIYLLLVTLLVNCSSIGTFVPIEKINSLEPYMTQEEIINFIGKPDRTSYSNQIFTWKYFNVREKPVSTDRYTYYLLFTGDKKLYAWGTFADLSVIEPKKINIDLDIHKK